MRNCSCAEEGRPSNHSARRRTRIPRTAHELIDLTIDIASLPSTSWSECTKVLRGFWSATAGRHPLFQLVERSPLASALPAL